MEGTNFWKSFLYLLLLGEESCNKMQQQKTIPKMMLKIIYFKILTNLKILETVQRIEPIFHILDCQSLGWFILWQSSDINGWISWTVVLITSIQKGRLRWISRRKHEITEINYEPVEYFNKRQQQLPCNILSKTQ